MTSFSFLPLGGGKAAAAVDSKHSKVFVDKVVSYFYETEIDLWAGWVVVNISSNFPKYPILRVFKFIFKNTRN